VDHHVEDIGDRAVDLLCVVEDGHGTTASLRRSGGPSILDPDVRAARSGIGCSGLRRRAFDTKEAEWPGASPTSTKPARRSSRRRGPTRTRRARA
jgi:hypothetical protein